MSQPTFLQCSQRRARLMRWLSQTLPHKQQMQTRSASTFSAGDNRIVNRSKSGSVLGKIQT